MSHYPEDILKGPKEPSTPSVILPSYGMKSPTGHTWNGQRWVSPGEWETALRIKEHGDKMLIYYDLPWYKRIVTRRPR